MKNTVTLKPGLAVTQVKVIRVITYEFAFTFYSNFGASLYRFGDIA